jgi:hypothetical protein
LDPYAPTQGFISTVTPLLHNKLAGQAEFLAALVADQV